MRYYTGPHQHPINSMHPNFAFSLIIQTIIHLKDNIKQNCLLQFIIIKQLHQLTTKETLEIYINKTSRRIIAIKLRNHCNVKKSYNKADMK